MKKMTRRAFLATGGLIGGGLVLGVALAPNRLLIGAEDTGAETALNTWVKIAPDNKITVIVPHAEMGQGSQTALAMMLAEELEADWSLVSVEQAPATSDYANSDIAHAVIAGFVIIVVAGIIITCFNTDLQEFSNIPEIEHIFSPISIIFLITIQPVCEEIFLPRLSVLMPITRHSSRLLTIAH